jgi:choline kinase
MKALILAAGMGTRLRPLTDTRPKCLVEVNGKPIIFNQIDNLGKNGIKNITVVAGYKSDMLKHILKEKYPFIDVIENSDYKITNNMYSAYLTKDNFYERDFLLLNGDVYFDDIVISELLKQNYENAIVVEKDEYNEESMKVICNNMRIIGISKEISKDDAFGVSIDIYRFSSTGAKVFFNKITEYIEDKKIYNQWTEAALNDILPIVEFKPCPLKGRWIEIDDHNDLKKAECIFG